MRLNTKLPYSSPECHCHMALFYDSLICSSPDFGQNEGVEEEDWVV